MFHIVLVLSTHHPGVHGIDEQRKMLCPAGFFIYKYPECSRTAVQHPRNRLFQWYDVFSPHGQSSLCFGS